MPTIWKYPLTIEDSQAITMKEHARIIAVQNQNDTLIMWAWVDPNATDEVRHIRLIGTGHPIDPALLLDFLGTVQLLDGKLVLHVFEELCP